jgi:hypothetical protein
MKFGRAFALFVVAAAVLTCRVSAVSETASPARTEIAQQQVPSWSKDDLNFFLHGSMSTEVVPESVLRAFIKTYPDLFPSSDLSHFGLIPDKDFGWPIGLSRKNVQHLGGLPAVGINCASCHVAQITSISRPQPIEILGVTSHFNVEGFFGSVLVATFKTSEPDNMKKFLAAYLALDPNVDEETQQILGKPSARAHEVFENEWQKQEQHIKARMVADPFGSKGVVPGELHTILSGAIVLDGELITDGRYRSELPHRMLRLFHNMRAALHVPDKPPDKVPPASGPGRNDAFGLLSASLLNMPQPYSPIKFGLVWNVDKRTWVHWDGNTKSPIARNLLASLGLGAPMHGKRGEPHFCRRETPDRSLGENRTTEISI